MNFYMTYQNHPYHLTEISFWPIVLSFSVFSLASSFALYFHHFSGSGYTLILSFILLFSTIIFWTNDVSREADFMGDHTTYVSRGINYGFGIFIFTEVLFFIGFFWGYFHSALNPTVEIGSVWPPAGINPLNAYELPLLNTIILLSSGATATYSHHALISGNRVGSINGLIATLFLGMLFLVCQYIEYSNASFTIADGIYGSCFYIITGLHGSHVIVGVIFLFVCFLRMYSYRLTSTHHEGFAISLIYWHFVDIVWLIVLTSIYFWGS